MTEAQYQAKLIKKLYKAFPGCEVLKNDAEYRQGMLDLTVLWGARWAMLEVKATPEASVQPNQRYYVSKLDAMSFAAFIHPENEAEVLSALQEAFQSLGAPRFPQS